MDLDKALLYVLGFTQFRKSIVGDEPPINQEQVRVINALHRAVLDFMEEFGISHP